MKRSYEERCEADSHERESSASRKSTRPRTYTPLNEEGMAQMMAVYRGEGSMNEIPSPEFEYLPQYSLLSEQKFRNLCKWVQTSWFTDRKRALGTPSRASSNRSRCTIMSSPSALSRSNDSGMGASIQCSDCSFVAMSATNDHLSMQEDSDQSNHDGSYRDADLIALRHAAANENMPVPPETGIDLKGLGELWMALRAMKCYPYCYNAPAYFIQNGVRFDRLFAQMQPELTCTVDQLLQSLKMLPRYFMVVSNHADPGASRLKPENPAVIVLFLLLVRHCMSKDKWSFCPKCLWSIIMKFLKSGLEIVTLLLRFHSFTWVEDYELFLNFLRLKTAFVEFNAEQTLVSIRPIQQTNSRDKPLKDNWEKDLLKLASRCFLDGDERELIYENDDEENTEE